MKIASLFSGAGGLDIGFELAGFDIAWANEYDKSIWGTFEYNFPETTLDRRSITEIDSRDIPFIDGIVGGPPCQSWSEAGARRGIDDRRGQLFFEYVRILRDKKPLFFLAENVSGMLFLKNRDALNYIISLFKELDYNVSYYLLNSMNYGTPQSRERLIIVGYRSDTNKIFYPPKPDNKLVTLADTIWDLRDNAKPALAKNKTNGKDLAIPNHEYFIGGFSTIYMSRNRVKNWNEQSFTIQASGRHAPIHPQAPKMELVGKDKRVFVACQEHLYRRLSVRECARIQTFPDSYIFKYENLDDGYKMVGNAVPVEFARQLAAQIYNDLKEFLGKDTINIAAKDDIRNKNLNDAWYQLTY
ncbi:DNA cytosine methyltransferase [Candidatus Chlorohelix sp.]|uniref:DNA cytosine methyltransferase n=1 Tax=Candidatus Chlorohelix sp. TaxID=3139201 RepID=UPI0030252509